MTRAAALASATRSSEYWLLPSWLLFVAQASLGRLSTRPTFCDGLPLVEPRLRGVKLGEVFGESTLEVPQQSGSRRLAGEGRQADELVNREGDMQEHTLAGVSLGNQAVERPACASLGQRRKGLPESPPGCERPQQYRVRPARWLVAA